MMKLIRLLPLLILFSNTVSGQGPKRNFNPQTLLYDGEEKHLSNVKQLTFGGDNAEAYFSFDSRKITFQATNKAWGETCDQIYWHNLDDAPMHDRPALISTQKGRTTCSFFLPGDSTILFASTHLAGSDCPPTPAKRTDGKYVWPVYDSFDIFISDLKGNIIKQLTNTKGYDAEGTVSPKGDMIVFTSMRSGDLELYTMNIDGSNVKQITNQLGYDGGAFFSPDGKKLIFRASRPSTPEEIKEYKDLLNEGLVQPTEMDLYICDIDGSHLKKVTDFANAEWAPFFLPSGKKVIFSSNYQSKKGLPFNLYVTDLKGKKLEQITFDSMFDAFPMFSPDGKKLIFSSNRNNNGTHDTNLFIADWKD
jgi:TolB protein